MERKYKEFKLNLGPDILEAYNFDMEQIKHTIIPEDLKKIFSETVLTSSYKYTFHVKQASFLDTQEYYNFVKMAKNHEKEYLKIVKSFKETGGFSYTAEYQNLNETFGKLLSDILKKFPYLEEAFSIKDNSINEDLVFRVGTGKKYIERQRKIIKYLDSKTKFDSEFSFDFYYEPSSEHIYITAEEDTVSLAKLIQEEINKNRQDTNIGEISINPISDKVKIDIKQKNPLKEVEFTYVYPNGHKEVNERAQAIKKMKAEKEQVKYTTSSNEGFSVPTIEELATEESKKGYLSDIRHRGKSIIKWIQREVSKEFN